MKFIIITIILSIESCVTAIPKLRETNKHYVIAPFQVELKEMPSEKSKTIQKINPYQEIELHSIEKEEIVLEKYGSSPWAKITYGISQGYIPYYFVEDKLEYIKLKSEAFNGLVLRESPAKLGKKIAVIPLLDEMEFLERTDKKEKISRFNSYWIKVKYKDNIGYVYSGNTNYEFIENFLLGMLPEMNESRNSRFKSRIKFMKKNELQKFQVYENIRGNYRGWKCDRYYAANIYFKIKDKLFYVQKSKILYDIAEDDEDDFFVNEVEKFNFPINNSLLIHSQSSIGCKNNLTLEDDSLIVYLKGKLHQIKFFKNSEFLECKSNHKKTDSIKFLSVTRFIEGKKILFFHIKIPNCIFEDSEKICDFHNHESTDVANEIFARIDLSGDIPKQTIYYNRGIPNKFLNEWNQAKIAID